MNRRRIGSVSRRSRQLRGRACVATVTLLVVASTALAGCRLPFSGDDEERCDVSSLGVPECGALWGITTQTPGLDEVTRLEDKIGRRFDLVYRFHDINDEVPTEDERELVDQGRLLHVTIESRDYTDPLPAAGTWAAIAAGRHDDTLIQQAEGIASLDAPVFVTFDHEVDQSARQELGTPEEFVAAWRHLNTLFAEAGADNAVWVWVILGYEPSLPLAASYWPGDDVVDWISWDIYNQSGCRGAGVDPELHTTFEDDVELVYDWVYETGPSIGMDPEKPMMISEFGSVLYDDDPERTADWYAAVPAVLEKYPQIKAVALWDHDGNLGCDYRVERDDAVIDAVVEAGQQPWVNQQPE